MVDQAKHAAKLNGARVLIIGGSSGIGFGVAEGALEYGATVTISSSNKSRLSDSVAKLKTSYPSAESRIKGFTVDLSNPETVEQNIEELFHNVGILDHVVFTAGDALAMVPLQNITPEIIQKASQLRFSAPLLVAKHAQKYLSPGPKSSISLTAGVIAERPVPGWVLISGFAAGLQGIARGLAIDLKPTRVNVVQPGFVDTNLYATSGIPSEVKEGLFADGRQKLPVGKIGTPEDLAEAYLYLMKDENVTGEILNSSGGQLLV